jgi:hypothetical protein
MYAQNGYSRAIAFRRAMVSSLGGVGSVLSSIIFSTAWWLFSRVKVEVLFVAVANLKVFFFMRQKFTSSE